MEEENKKEKKTKEQEFIVETPIEIEERINGSDKIIKYERGKFLGKGGFAKCYEMKRVDTGKIFAAKVFEKKALNTARTRKKLINEIKLHKKLHHQNIVNFEHFFEDKDSVYILLELCSNQTLNELVKRRKRLTEIEVQCYSLQIIKALKYIHSHRIIHRDLKLGNLFLTNKLELKLGDFGLAAKLEYDGQRRRTVCGTPNYIAPEVLEKKNGHSYEVDIWSLGVVMYTMLFGRPPFETADVKLTYKRIKMNSYSFPENIKVDSTAKKLISSILNLDPSKRPSLDAIADHDFFKMYHSVPLILPLSTLSCPPSQNYIAQFAKNDSRFQNGQNEYVNQNSNQNNLDLHRRNESNNGYKNPMNSSRNNNKDLNNFNSDGENENNLDELDDPMLKKLGDVNNGQINMPPIQNYFSRKISRYFDYSSKFGFVYFINNTHIGICFNDFSNILRHMVKDSNESDLANTNNYDYIYLEKDAQSSQNFDEIELENYLASKNTSKDIIKKFDIFKHIVNKHLNDFEKVKKEKYVNNAMTYNNDSVINKLFFVKKFFIGKNAVLFRLSNKLIQIFFNDGTEIIFSTETSDFVYKSKKGEETQESIQNAMNGDENDIIKKIKIAKNLLIYFVKNQKSKKVPK
jgi:polo-like kinase 1